MCTLSWAPDGDCYRIWMNRDEEHQRPLARPPSIRRLGLVRFVAPTDGQAGGTWIATSERGLTLCLLNQHGKATTDEPVLSRGYVVASLIDCRTRAELIWRCAGAGLARFLPFTLAAFEVDRPALLLTWDGERLTTGTSDRAGLVATSSSVASETVEQTRRELFARHLSLNASRQSAHHEHLHRSHQPARGALSVCMHRSDAATVSLTSVHVTPDQVQMTYIPGAPCEGAAPLVSHLPRASERWGPSPRTSAPRIAAGW